MASKQNMVLRYGSSGGSVSELQKLLNNNGYSLDVDGNFGAKTQAAVKDYQTKNKLTVDGMVGDETMGALSGVTAGNSSNGAKATASNEGFSYKDFSYDDYAESDTVSQAQAALQQQLAAKPGAYQSQWQEKIDSILDSIMNREDFSYDVNGDALYQQYKDQYTALGKLAMQDTMGQAAAMTGGYGNSYASAVGNQAYQSYLSQVNEVVPELYAMALDKYNQEGNELYKQYSLLADQENQDYGRYQDTYNQWLSERDYLAGVYNDERSFDYSQYANDRDFAYGTYADDKSYAYNEYRNAIADEQWQKQYDESVRQYNEQMAITQEQWDLEKQQYKDSSKSYSGTTSTGKSYNNGSLTNAEVKELQAALGIDADGYYGPASKEAAGGLSAAKAYAKYVGGADDTNDSTPKSNFTGKTYEEATSYLKSNGVPAGTRAGLMTQSEWARRKASYNYNGTGSTEVKNYNSYAEYLADYVEFAIETYGS